MHNVALKEQSVSQKKNLQIYKWERYEYSHLLSMTWEKYSHTLQNLLVSHTWELCGLPNSINF